MLRCRHTSPGTIIGWRMNVLSPVSAFPDITTGFIIENGTVVYTLSIPARSEYNGTEVVCLAVFRDGSPIGVANASSNINHHRFAKRIENRLHKYVPIIPFLARVTV